MSGANALVFLQWSIKRFNDDSSRQLSDSMVIGLRILFMFSEFKAFVAESDAVLSLLGSLVNVSNDCVIGRLLAAAPLTSSKGTLKTIFNCMLWKM